MSREFSTPPSPRPSVRCFLLLPHSPLTHDFPIFAPHQVLSFHTNTNCPFCKSFVLTFIQNARGVYPPTGRKRRTMTTQAPETEVLNPEAPSLAAIGDPSPADSRCQHRYANGKRCRLPAKSSHSGLCKTHSQRKPKAALLSMPSDFDDLSEDLLRGLSHFRSSEDLREFLSRLLVETTKGRVSPRRAAVLAYITNQLLHSHCVVQKEERELDNQSQPIIFDLPRPKRDWPEGSERAFYEHMSSQSVPNDSETPNITNTKESS